MAHAALRCDSGYRRVVRVVLGMTSVDLPVFLVAFKDTWVGNRRSPRNSIPAFGTREDAEAFARDVALSEDHDPSMYRIVEYVFSGNVMEA